MLIALVVLVAVAAGAAYAVLSEPKYRSSTALKFERPEQNLDLFGGAVAPQLASDKLAAASLGTIKEPAVARLANRRLKNLKPPVSITDIGPAINASVDPESNLVILEATADTAEAAAQIATLAADVTANIQNRRAKATFDRQVKALEKELDIVKRGGSEPESLSEAQLKSDLRRLRGLAILARPVSVAQVAEIPDSPDSPRPARDIILAGFLGFLLGIVAALAREALDRRVHSSDEIEETLGLPIVGLVPDRAMGQTPFARNGSKPMEERDIEGFRILRTNLAFLSIDRPPRSVIVTSALPEEGKSTVAAALALASASAGARTLLVECDLRRPTLAARLGIDREPGLTDYLYRRLDLAEVLQLVETSQPVFEEEGATAVGEEGLAGRQIVAGSALQGVSPVCVAAGSRAFQPAEVLGSDQFREFLQEATDAYDLVILDSSPLLSVVDTRELLPLVDAVLLCVRVSRTTRDQMTAAKEAIGHFPSRPTAVVATGLRPRDEPDYGYYSYEY